MPSNSAISKNGREKQKTHENKYEEPERRQKINTNFRQQMEQPIHKKQAIQKRYRNNTGHPYYREERKNF